MRRRLERFAGRPVAFVDTALPGWAAPHANDALREVRRSTVSSVTMMLDRFSMQGSTCCVDLSCGMRPCLPPPGEF